MGDRANRLDVLLDIAGNELAIAPHAALHVHKMVGVADGADALGNHLTLSSKALVLVASGFHVLRNLPQVCCGLGGMTWATLCRCAVGIGEVLVPLLEHRFSLRNGL